MLPGGAAKIEVLEICAMPWGGPGELRAKMPGPAAFRATDTAGPTVPFTVTVIVTKVWLTNSQGTWKLIWLGETKNSGAEVPLICTLTPFSVVGRGRFAAGNVAAPKLMPK